LIILAGEKADLDQETKALGSFEDFKSLKRFLQNE